MKTIKLILSIAGFTLTSICFGQLLSKNNNDLLFYSSHYNLASNRMEHRIDPFPARISSGDHFEAPLISRTYFVPTEFDMDLETWMSKPFETTFYEEELLLESWMISPFESSYYEADPVVEPWMTKPFESSRAIEDELEIEEWMTSPWV